MRIKNFLKFVRSSDDYTHINGSKLKQKPKIIEISIVKWILVVPFYFQSDPILKAVDFVCR